MTSTILQIDMSASSGNTGKHVSFSERPEVTDRTGTATGAIVATGATASIGAWSSRHHLMVLGAWILLLISATVGHHALSSSYSDTLTIPGSKAQEGLNVLRAHDPKAGGQGGQLVFSDRSSPLNRDGPAIEQARTNVSHLPHVLTVSDPLSPATVSGDGHNAFATVNFDANPQSLGMSYVRSVDQAVKVATDAGVTVTYGGSLGQADTPKGGDSRSELVGIVVASVVLLVGFGSVYAALLPLASAIIGVVTGIGLLGIVAAAIALGTDSPTLATMMGLGVGIDYALFLTTRHRQMLIDGDDPGTAIGRTMAASGRSVVLAASTVVIAMLGLYASGITFIGKLGLAAAIAVTVAALAALTLVPALLGFARARIDRLHVRRPVAEPATEHSMLHAYTHLVARHPWRFATGGTGLLLIIAVPTLSMQFGHIGPGSAPTSYSERQAYDTIAKGFGAGANGPLTIVVQLAHATTAQQAARIRTSLQDRLEAVNDVGSVTPFLPSTDGALLVGRLVPRSGPGTTATTDLVEDLQDTVLPRSLSAYEATGYVTGTTATTVDFENTVSSRLPVIIGVVIAAAFVLLLSAFRSPVVALKAALLNLLSIGAAYGILVAAFQWGWASSLFGVPGTVPIESYVPMIVFAIVFGLSMDYEVFLISRIREHWLSGRTNRDSVANGLAQTARVITCAAVILASVFFAFLLSTNVTVKMLALGLGASVIIDATVIRLMIVPALMFLFDRANWWAPDWLDRILPRFEPELGAWGTHIDKRLWMAAELFRMGSCW
jgi:RND superfamily putative drug exporter